MKKAKLDKEQWLAAYSQLEKKGFITRVFDPDSGEMINRPTKNGIEVYRAILAYYETDHLFNGPRMDPSDLNDEELIQVGRTLNKMGIVHVYYDSKTGQERFALGQFGWELMSVYSDCIDEKSKNFKQKTKGKSDDPMQKLGVYIFKFMKTMNKAGKMAQKFEKSSGGSPRFDTAGMSNYGNTKPRTTGKKGSKTKKRKARSETEFWR